MKIEAAGIYRDFDITAYHGDPCPTASLSQSLAKILIERSPLHAAFAHPRLKPAEQVDDEIEKYVKAQAIGDAAHALMIGRGKSLAIAEFDSWRSDKAKAFREAAEIAGKMPILEKHFQQAGRVASAAGMQLDTHEERDCFESGAGEVVLAWQEGPIWFRCLVDWLHDDLRSAEDYKTTGMSVAEHVIGARAADAGWDIQAAMIERGLDALDPRNVGKRRFRFVAQEQDAPFALNVMVMTSEWMTMGRKKLQYAVDLWTRCTAEKKWPGYAPYGVRPEYPAFKEGQWLAREIKDAANDRRPEVTNILAAG